MRPDPPFITSDHSLDYQQAIARLLELTQQVERNFERVHESEQTREKETDFAALGLHSREGQIYDLADAIETRTYTHRTYVAGKPKAEGDLGPIPSETPGEAVQCFEDTFLPFAAQHSGTLYWRTKPELKHVEYTVSGDEGWFVRCRCAFGDSPDRIERASGTIHETTPSVGDLVKP